MIPKFTATPSTAPAVTSNEEATGHSTPAAKKTSLWLLGAGNVKAEDKLKMMKRKDDSQRTQVLAKFHGSKNAGAALEQQRALKTAVQRHGEPSSANAHEEYSVTGTKYSDDHLSRSEAGRHFLHRLEALERMVNKRPPLTRNEVQRTCEGITDCAEALAGKLGTRLEDIDPKVLKENGLESKDPASFKLTDDEYHAVCQKVQSLYAVLAKRAQTLEASFFASPF